jgi:aminopeptidase
MSGDPRTQNLAKILVGYSTKVKEGEVVSIDGENAAAPLLLAVYEEVLKAGGNPVLNVALDGQIAAYFKHASDKQLEWISPFAEWMVDNADVRIAIGASTNTRELSGVPPERQTLRQSVTGDLMNRAMKRSAEGDFRWVYTLFPTSAYASEAEMSLADYEDFYYGACLADDPDPLTAWKRASEETNRLAEWIEGHEEVRITAPGTDIKLGIAGRTFIPCVGDHNMPDGEFFTGPVEDSVEGEVTFHLPAVIAGREVSGVHLRFEAGKVVDASAERGEEFLIQLLDTDEGARRLGEVALVPHSSPISKSGLLFFNTLFDENAASHIALGQCYSKCFVNGDKLTPQQIAEQGGNKSLIHIDWMIGSAHTDIDGIHADGRSVPVFRKGEWA